MSEEISYGKDARAKERSDSGMRQAPDQQTEAARATPDDIVVRPSTDADAPAMIAIYTRYVTHGLAKARNSSRCRPTTSSAAARTCRSTGCRIWSRNCMAWSSATPMPCPSANGPPIAIASNTRSMCIENYLRAGVGRKLLPALIEACAGAGYRQMIAYVDSENRRVAETARSLRLSSRRLSRRRSASVSAAGPTASCCNARWGRAAARRPPGYVPISPVGVGDVGMESD